MKYNFDNLVIPSFVLWVDHILTYEGQAYTNTGSILYPMADNRKGLQYNVYSAPFRSWVADSSVTGANIPSGVYQGNTFIPRGTNGLKIDYQNGRVFISGAALQLTGNYAVKDYVIKYTNDTEDNILFNDKYTFVPQFSFNQPFTGIPDDTITLPAIFIKYEQGESLPVSFGEEFVDTTSNFRVIVLTQDAGLLDNILGRLRDKARRIFPVFSAADLPFDYYGDIKNGSYNYLNLINNKIGYSFISSSKSAKFPESINIDIGRDVFGGYVDIVSETYRNPKGIF